MTTIYFLDQGHPKEIAQLQASADAKRGAPVLQSPGTVEPPSHLAPSSQWAGFLCFIGHGCVCGECQ